MVSYDATTDAVTVTVRPVYLDDKSDPIQRRFVFAYHVRIENRGAHEVQLLHRCWRIVDADGRVQDVEGAGVVGRQPTIPPGAAHEYHSYCVLPTFTGTMEGSYLMERAGGEPGAEPHFLAAIPLFHLSALAN